jgi:hypothetical protein
MRILLAAPHRYPMYGKSGSGFLPRRYPSGSAFHLHDLLARGLAELGHEVWYYLAEGAESPLPPGVTLAAEPLGGVDICHAIVGPGAFADEVVEAMGRLNVPILLSCHMKEGHPGAPNWLFVSRALAGHYGSDRVVLNGIDPSELCFSAEKDDYFLFLSSLNRPFAKGVDFALSVARSRGVRLVVAGTATTAETISEVSALCRDFGAEYLGDVRGPLKAGLLARARALLFPSRLPEGCPLVVLEALMSGTPVISTPCGGVVEILTPDTGFLCPEDEADWLDAMDRISTISPHRCREVALANYHYRRMVSDYLREYQKEIAATR